MAKMHIKSWTGRSLRLTLFGAALVPYVVLLASPGKQAVKEAPTNGKIAYGRDIEPMIKAHCASCHSGAAPAGGLDVTSSKGLLKGGVSGKVIDAGNPQASVFLQRIKGLGGKPAMPMGFPALAPEDIQKIEKWIAAGASFEAGGGATHWAYVAPVLPAVPALNSSWVRNPIDAFVLAKLRKETMHPSPEASKETLIRRATLGVTGLPPTPEEIDAFLADKSPTAYEKVVDRLLASPHYGERQARGWLDLARYADSDGYEKDLHRNAYPFRDWVINAFNANMPFDQFTIKQIAGDLLPNANVDDLVATGFHRGTMFNREGGVNQEEAHFAVILDRVDTTATVWLGSTLGCARCHDHKYDPFTQKDYYKMAAFFSNSVVIPRGSKAVGEENWFEPDMAVPTAAQAEKMKQLKAQIAACDTKLQAPDPVIDAAYAEWTKSSPTPADWLVLKPAIALSAAGESKIEADGSVFVGGANPARNTYTLVLHSPTTPTTGMRLDVLPDDRLGGKGPGRAGNGNFVMTGFKVTANGKPIAYHDARADFIQEQFGLDRLAKSDKGSGWAISPQFGKPHKMIVTFDQPIPGGTQIDVVLECQSRFAEHTLGHFRIAATNGEVPGAELTPDGIRAILAKSSRTAKEEKELRAFFDATTPLKAKVRAERVAAQSELDAVNAAVPTTLIMRETPGTKLLTCYVRHRGEFASKAELVPAGTPAVLPTLTPGRADRLTLANWLVSKKNPLTARVEVNRIWEQYFGRGLVETSEDFGTRGSKPSHPELLDWLACQFMAKGWDMKAIHRMILMSSTFRQSSEATEAAIAKDQPNVFLARGPRFRLDAEFIRDASLAEGGLLSSKVGGPSVYPYQPDGIWDSPYSGEAWMTSMGEDQYRRSIYTFWKRTAPYPSFVTFDATSRESCTVRRIRTNTPLQALTLLNDREMIVAASGLAKRMKSVGKSDADHIVAGFRVCTGRKPLPSEVSRLTALLTKLEGRYSADVAAAKKLGSTPQEAAWTMVGNVLLNLDETITNE